jgi:phospholipid N-methyltransferase
MKVEGGKETFELQRALEDPVSLIYKGRRGRRTAARRGEPSVLQMYWRFLVAGLTRHTQTGAVVPSQRFLVDQMIAPVPADYRGDVVELGAGTGVLTMRLAAKCSDANITACEINPILARDTHARVSAADLGSRVRVTPQPAEEVLATCHRRPAQWRPKFVISGIPLGNLRKESALELIRQIYNALMPGGMYIQFQYSLLDRKKIKTTFSRLRTVPVLLNFPPAFVYYATK